MRCLYVYLYTQACTQIDFKCMHSAEWIYHVREHTIWPQSSPSNSPEDVNITGKPTRSRAFLSEFLRKCRHWEIQIKARLKKSDFWTTLQLSSRSHQGGPWWCMWLFPGAGRGMFPSPGLSQPGCQWVPHFLHQGTVTVILFLCPLQLWTLLSLNFWPHKCQD